ncbi:PREDICTED: uncharacterized protein LOC109158884 [Ipomoea nil]|uniref:uncharacterized protein LOC109158884 n=1 Tax=Ipomoea nil TaxID=35883 RepID=UPI0009013D9A|nr:PREDICTED: uncharacterized protein LOC109158884 [Ipomoea nil]
MQRQSLGSPGSKHLLVQGGRDDVASATVTAADSTVSLPVNYAEDEERKSVKYLSKSENYVHLIPVLTILCFLILYLSSHNPSDKDLAQFSGSKAFSKPIGNIDNFQKDVDVKRGDILAIRSLRNLREAKKKYRFNRKMAEF